MPCALGVDRPHGCCQRLKLGGNGLLECLADLPKARTASAHVETTGRATQAASEAGAADSRPTWSVESLAGPQALPSHAAGCLGLTSTGGASSCRSSTGTPQAASAWCSVPGDTTVVL